ncbi:MAG: hypoxanthine phosphoribosyltransferase [Proteobacteria bacterium]|nr:hypoxanthine phosphoribosyltransferase [Pseudomonadota bacterium]
MTSLDAVFGKDRIQAEVSQMAQRISVDYQDGELVLVGVLMGAFIFLADLARNLTIPAGIDFIRLSSYGMGTNPAGGVHLSQDVTLNLTGKDVLLVEDIVDTGITAHFLMEHCKGLGARSVRLCALIDKNERRQKAVEIHYSCLSVPRGFLVGYGLDHAEKYRGLPGIYALKP